VADFQAKLQRINPVVALGGAVFVGMITAVVQDRMERPRPVPHGVVEFHPSEAPAMHAEDVSVVPPPEPSGAVDATAVGAAVHDTAPRDVFVATHDITVVATRDAATVRATVAADASAPARSADAAVHVMARATDAGQRSVATGRAVTSARAPARGSRAPAVPQAQPSRVGIRSMIQGYLRLDGGPEVMSPMELREVAPGAHHVHVRLPSMGGATGDYSFEIAPGEQRMIVLSPSDLR
jgi:hypothetical protein